MRKLIYFFLIFTINIAAADPTLTDQLNALDNAQNQARANENARAQDAYNAQLAEQRRLEKIAAQQRDADRRLQEKAIQERAAANRAAAINAKIAADKADAQARAENEERLLDKARIQTQEDEEREYIKQQSALKLQEAELEVQRLKAKADLELAIANDRIKSVNEETSLARKKETTEIDVVQSGADATRAVANGIESNLSGMGNEGLYKFLVVLFLIILVVLAVVFMWKYSIRQKFNKNLDSQEVENKSS